MSEPIKVGDLVAVTKWPCCGYKLGRTFTVRAIEPSPTGLCICVGCEARHPTSADALDHKDGWTPLPWLTRIQPLGELDDVKRDETVSA